MLSDKIGVIGAGKIGSALLTGTIGTGLVRKEQVLASAPRPEARERLAAELGIRLTADNAEVCDFADIVILAVKPQVAQSVLRPLSEKFARKKLLISIAAGLPTDRLESLLEPGARVVRVMTNTPCVVRSAASAYAKGSHATAEDLQKTGAILSSVGVALPVDERYLDAVTGLSGSGPAYVFFFIEALVDGGVQMGLSRDTSLKLAVHTVYGAAKMALQSDKHLGQLKDEVTSPGGTTIAGLFAMEQAGFKGTVMEAIVQATRRSQTLGKGES